MESLSAISDWIALCDAKARYCRLLDTKDWEGFGAMFTEDYELDVSDGTGLPIIKGRKNAIAQVRASIESARTAHQVHSPEINLKGDEAFVIWAMQDRVVWGGDRPAMTGYGHYHEQWVRTTSGWKIARLKLTRLHLDIQLPVAPKGA